QRTGIADRYRASLAEIRLEPGESVERLIGSRSNIFLDRLTGDLGSDGSDLLAQGAAFLRGDGAAMTFQGKLVLLLSSDAEFRRQHLGRLPHDQARYRVGQAELDAGHGAKMARAELQEGSQALPPAPGSPEAQE